MTVSRVLLNNWSLCILLGLGSAAAAVSLHALETKFLVAALGGALLLLSMALMGDRKRLFYFLLALFAFSIPFNLSANFLYQRHIGGAPSIYVSLSTVAVAALFLLMFYDRLKARELFAFQYERLLVFAFSAYLLSGVASLINAEYPMLTFFELLRLCFMFSVLLLMMNLKEQSYLRSFLFLLSVAVVVEAVIAVIQYKTGSTLGLGFLGEESLVEQNLGHTVKRATGTIGHPNTLGYFFEILIPLFFAMYLVTEKKWLSFWYALVAGCGMFGILTTLSRGAWLTLPISLSLVGLTLFRGRRLTLGSAIATVAIGMVALISLSFAYPTIEKRLMHDDYRSSGSRMPLNKGALSVFQQFPVFGVGLNNFSEVFKKYDTTGNARIFKGYQHVVHNLYLLVCTEIGTVGFLAFLAVLGSVFLTAARLLPQVPFDQQGILVGISSGIAAHMIHGLFDPGFVSSASISTLIYSLAGVVGAISLFHRNSRQPATGLRDRGAAPWTQSSSAS